MDADPSSRAGSPQISIVVILYDMSREATRSLHSLSAIYQENVSVRDYEVVVIDNGSPNPPDKAWVESFGSNFRYLSIPAEEAPHSPCAAINYGIALSQAPNVGVMIDGARIASPGIVALALQALQKFNRAIVATIGFHLGPAMQKWAPMTGYDQYVEDALLDEIGWPGNGYRLFDISALTGVNWSGWFGPMGESNLIFLSRSMYEEIGGFDEAFDLPGGELANLDFYRRAAEAPESTLISLFGEATFHQIHGGTLSSASEAQIRSEVKLYRDRYEARTGQPFRPSIRLPLLFGYPRPEISGCIAEIFRPGRPGPAEPPAVDGNSLMTKIRTAT